MADSNVHPEDELLARNEDLEKVSSAARLFDVRRVIGGLFLVYGVIVTLMGIFESKSELAKAQGVRINLWMGLGMLALGVLMLVWLRLNPAKVPDISEVHGSDIGPDASAEN
jgi:hypothetical protein